MNNLKLSPFLAYRLKQITSRYWLRS